MSATSSAPREIERKFLVPCAPATLLAAHPGQSLAQGYLTAGNDGAPAEVRVRRPGDGAAVLTVKSAGGGLVRTEVELPLTAADFAALWPLTERRRLEKVRHRVPAPGGGGAVIEVDVYGGTLAGLVVAEMEFPDVDAARRFQPPDWFGREVTDDAAFRNAALARAGFPPA